MKIPPKPLCERSGDVLLGNHVQAIAMRSDGSELQNFSSSVVGAELPQRLDRRPGAPASDRQGSRVNR